MLASASQTGAVHHQMLGWRHRGDGDAQLKLLPGRSSDDVNRGRDTTPVLWIGGIAKNVEEPFCEALGLIIAKRCRDSGRLFPHLPI